MYFFGSISPAKLRQKSQRHNRCLKGWQFPDKSVRVGRYYLRETQALGGLWTIFKDMRSPGAVNVCQVSISFTEDQISGCELDLQRTLTHTQSQFSVQ